MGLKEDEESGKTGNEIDYIDQTVS